jgi:iron(III) transport system permease protein
MTVVPQSGSDVSRTPTRSGRHKRHLKYSLPLLGTVFLLVVAPLVFILLGAFRTGSLADPDAEFSLENLQTVYATVSYLTTIGYTLLLACTVAALALTGGAFFAWLINRTDVPLRGTIELAVIAPLFLSPFVGAVAWLILGSERTGFLNVVYRQLFGSNAALFDIRSLYGAIFVMTLYYIPYGYLFTSGSLRNMDPGLEDSSYINGAGIARTAMRVTLPLMKPSMLSAFFFVFVLSAGLFAVPAVLGSGTGWAPLAVRIYQSVANYPPNLGEAAASGTVLLIMAVIGIAFYQRATRQADRFVTVTGRGFRPRRVNLRAWRWPAFALCICYGFLAVVLPYATLSYVSLTRFVTANFSSAQFTLTHWVEIITNPIVKLALGNTLIVAIVTPTVCVALAVGIAFVNQRIKATGGSVVDYIATMPVAVPGIVFGTGVLWTYVWSPLYGTIAVIILSFVAEYLPHSLRITRTGLVQIDRRLEEASVVSGASNARTLRTITVPLLKPSILSAWVLVFIFTSREVGSAVLLYGPSSIVLSVVSWNNLEYGNLQAASVIGLVQTGFIIIAIVVARFVFRVRLQSNG